MWHRFIQELKDFLGALLRLTILPDNVSTWLGLTSMEAERMKGDLPGLYSGATVFVYPSFYEGFGLPVLEAMSCGTPIITSNVSSLPEVAGDAGLLVDPQDAKALYQAVKAVLQDESLRASLSDRSLRRARLFSQERMATETLALYKEVAAMPLHRRSDLG